MRGHQGRGWEEPPSCSPADPNSLRPQGFPIIFHGVCGEDQREAKSPSFFNTAEIEILVQYLKKLLQSQGKRGCPTISPKEIGIISPYRKQVRGRQQRGAVQPPPKCCCSVTRASLQVEKIQKAITVHDAVLKALPDIRKLKVQRGPAPPSAAQPGGAPCVAGGGSVAPAAAHPSPAPGGLRGGVPGPGAPCHPHLHRAQLQ